MQKVIISLSVEKYWRIRESLVKSRMCGMNGSNFSSSVAELEDGRSIKMMNIKTEPMYFLLLMLDHGTRHCNTSRANSINGLQVKILHWLGRGLEY